MGASFRRLGPESSVIGNDGRQLEAGLIVKHRIGPAMLSGSVTAGRGWFDTGRLINQIGLFSYATGEQDMEFGSVHGQASFEIGLGENAYLRPILDLGYTRIRRDGFTEADAGAANLVVDGEKDSFTTFSPALEFGGEFSTASGTAIRPYLRVGSLRYLTDNRSDVTARLLDAPTGVAPFTITTVSDRSFAEYSLGLHVVDASGFGAQLAYQGQRSDNTHSEAATLKIYWPF